MENREIKFRARYKIDNLWNYFSLKDMSKLGVAFINYKDWSQYTGLKDKNGKEIYEGDIILMENTKYQVDYIRASFILNNLSNRVGDLPASCE